MLRNESVVGMMWRLKARGGSEVVTPKGFASRLPARKEGERAFKVDSLLLYLCRE